MRTTRGRKIATAAVTLSLTGTLLLVNERPAVSLSCWSYEDWEEVDIGPNDPYHHEEGQIDPEQQQPSGEWQFVETVEDRQGTDHELVEGFTIPSGEHPGCF